MPSAGKRQKEVRKRLRAAGWKSETDAMLIVRSGKQPLLYMPDEHEKEMLSECITFSSVSSSLLSSFFSVQCSCLCRLSTFCCRAWGEGETQSVLSADRKRKATWALCGVKWRKVIFTNLQFNLRHGLNLNERFIQYKCKSKSWESTQDTEVDTAEDRETVRGDAASD